MRRLWAWFARLGEFFHKERRDRELDAEMASHLEMHVEDNIHTGMIPEEARRQALVKLGGVEQIKENCRDRRGLPWLEILIQDVCFGLRMLAKNPGFTAVAILTLALGIGANTAIFSVVNTVVLHPLPVRDPQRVVVLHDQFFSLNVPRTTISAFQFREFGRRADLFESSAAMQSMDLNLTGRDQALRLQATETTAGLFPLLGIKPILGRAFTPDDERYTSTYVTSGGVAGVGQHVALLSEGLWRRLFGSDRSVIGRRLELNRESYEIVGVLSRGVEILFPQTELWVPAAFSPEQLSEKEHFVVGYTMLAKLRRGVSVKQARAGMETASIRRNGVLRFGVEVRSLVEEQVGDVRAILYILFSAVGLVLLMACTNVANLLLVRSGCRSGEIAIRAAIGASRQRIMSQLLTESLLLAVFGGVSGLLLAREWLFALVRIAPADLPRLNTIRLDPGVFGFTLLVSLMAGLLSGLAPALSSTRPDLANRLREGARGTSSGLARQRLPRVLVVSEIALALLLLVCSGLVLRSFTKLLDVPPGFDPNNVVTMKLGAKYGDPAQFVSFSNALIDRVSALPGVLHSAISTGVPFAPAPYGASFEIRDRHPVPQDPTPYAKVMYVTPAYFETMRIPLIRGRLYSIAEMRPDVSGEGAVRVIDEALAKRFWPDRDPIGAEIGSSGRWATIIGIVGSVHDSDLATEAKGTIYFPGYTSSPTLIVRTASDPKLLVGALRDQVRAVDADVSIYDVSTISELLMRSLERQRFAVILLTLFAVLALILACIGLYGVIAYVVTNRTHEIGLRMALGASPSGILKMVIGDGIKLALIGTAIGAFGALALTRLLWSLLFNVTPTDPITFVSMVVLLLAVALLACCIPARRAMRVDPMVALRYE